jgi:hypothetical protein
MAATTGGVERSVIVTSNSEGIEGLRGCGRVAARVARSGSREYAVDRPARERLDLPPRRRSVVELDAFVTSRPNGRDGNDRATYLGDGV